MSDVETLLAEVERLTRNHQMTDAEERLRSLLTTIGLSELRVWEFDIRQLIDRFYPKRKRDLTAVFNTRLAWQDPHLLTPRPADDLESPEVDLGGLEGELRIALTDLSERHIFQWGTFYRDCVSHYFHRFLDVAASNAATDEVENIILRQLSFHSHEIFQKGFAYQETQSLSQQQATIKSLAGLQRFLELPIEAYSAKAATTSDVAAARSLRRIGGAFLSAILCGYSATQSSFGAGAELLARYPRSWAHYLGFLPVPQFLKVCDSLAVGPFRDSVARAFSPVVQALDAISSQATDYVPLPALGQFVWDQRRVEVALRPPPQSEGPQLIELLVFLDSSFATRAVLEEALSRNVSLIVTPIKPDLLDFISRNDRLRRIVVPLEGPESSGAALLRRVAETLRYAIYERRSLLASASPLRYNFARDFPLKNPTLTRFYHVYRSSVRELLRTFERRNGVRLWCSVRRSGKTTSCFDLSSTAGDSVVVSQTCDSTTQHQDATLFYELVEKALADGATITKTFFRDAVMRCSPGRSSGDERLVFVLDEYETLFNRLRLAVKRDLELRYTVVQPLLNQMVAFGASNLIVFLGQQPNAHFILMDQNQLSAYIQQDPFPLFAHGPSTTDNEFAELLCRVLTDRVKCDSGFSDAVYAETSGHPFLTVNVLTAFVDWLIQHERALRDLRLESDDFALFAREQLMYRAIATNPEYMFFREAVSDAIGSESRSQNPWLYAVYSVLRQMAIESPKTLSFSKREFDDCVRQLELEQIGYSPEQLLSTAAQANFLQQDEKVVRPKIRLLARIAGTARPRMTG